VLLEGDAGDVEVDPGADQEEGRQADQEEDPEAGRGGDPRADRKPSLKCKPSFAEIQAPRTPSLLFFFRGFVTIFCTHNPLIC